MQRLGAAGHDDQAGDRRLGSRDPRGDRAAQAVPRNEYPVSIDGRMLAEQTDRRDRLGQILTGQGEVTGRG